MRILISFIFLGIIIPYTTFGDYAEDILTLSEKKSSVNAAKNIFFYIDQDNSLQFDQISSPAFNKFTPWNSTDNLSFEYGTGSYWAKVDIQNKDDQYREWLVEVAYAPLDELEFYLVKNEKLVDHHLTGDHVNYSERPIDHHNYLFPVALENLESATIYFRVKTNGIVKLPVNLYQPWKYAEVNSKYEVTYGILLGILAMLCILSVVTFLPTRDWSYLIFPLPLVAKIMFTFSLTGHTFQYLFPTSPVMANMITPLSIALWMLGESMFNLYFLKTRKLSKAAFYLNIFGFTLSIATIITSVFLSYYAAIKLVTVTAIPFSISALTLGIIAYNKGQRIARYYISAWSVYIFGLMIFVGFATGHLPDTFFTQHALEFGDLFMAPLLFTALSKKYAVYREQKNEAIKQMLDMEAKAKETLEAKVVERTLELQEATTELEEKTEELETQANQLEIKNEEVTSQAEELQSMNDQMLETNTELEQINEEIAAQRDMMEIKNKKLEVVTKSLQDSINYAQRIQKTILPQNKDFDTLFEDHFIMYRPKHTISGDFYWVTENTKEDKVVLIAADCTGHGVPGALMSVLGGGYLDKIINLKKITSPARILIEMHQNIQSLTSQEDALMNDGMDMGVLVWDRKEKKVTFAGTHTPLVFVQNNKLFSIKGDRFNLGSNHKKIQIKEHSIPLTEESSFYLFSDGFQDQFGGDHNKKISIKRLKELILMLSQKPMKVQHDAFIKFFESWKDKNNEKQIDDVLLMGVKIKA
ncbi:7TM-DISM domain-containing protein [Flammeovirga agarivorans]|uniref:SpoIIE family protein phosphatase n=1 Tax=Flammeovirga agarivorans TaxID=2726742 RepID=A0A7X8SM36_9BACT|nr:7TM-DISM domain-containing protein [Flammeovirga agarivorans]NLR92693.1 SpoIIE family protein phosphatase [Flammeovirga agarivorans]